VVGGSGLFALVIPVLIAPVFRRLSEALGANGPPSFAGAVLQGWVPPTLGALPLVVLIYALAVPQSLGRRRLLLTLAFALTVVASGLLLFALYGTLFSAAGAITTP